MDIEKHFVDRREWPRIAIDRLIDQAQLSFAAQACEDASPAEIVNLSEAGAGILMPSRIEKGTQVTLQILGKDIPNLKLTAEVRWSGSSPVSTGKFPLGLKFQSMDKECQHRLSSFIETMRKCRPSPS